MLVLTRNEGEIIRIGTEVVITVVKVKSTGRVRIGIEAPEYLRIVRGELSGDSGEFEIGESGG